MSEITVATHNGNFHADDVFSIAALKMVFPSFNLVRTRDPEVINNADIVIDVGGEYDPEKGRFDHHQRGGAGERENGIPYSSIGLVWQQYGLQICDDNQFVCNGVDAGIISTIDAIDCGYTEGVQEGISLSQTISMFNPSWQEDTHFDECFDEAVTFASYILKRFIASAKGGVEAKAIVAQAIEDAEDPRVIVLEQFVPWKKTVIENAEEALYIIYAAPTGQWRIQTVPVERGSFEDRQSLPKAWAGLADKELQDISGIDDAVFCHNGLFIAGAKSFESVMKMAKLALEEVQD